MSPRSRRERRRIAELEEEATELRSANLTLIKKVRELRQRADAAARGKDVTYLEEPRMTVRHYRKRPVVIEAIQFVPTKEGYAEFLSFVPAGIAMMNSAGATAAIKTLEGVMTVQAGDWVIRGVKGEFYPCKPDIFEQTYESVEQ